MECAGKNIRVNAVCPSFVDTPLMRYVFQQSPAMEQTILSSLPMGRQIVQQPRGKACEQAAMVHPRVVRNYAWWIMALFFLSSSVQPITLRPLPKLQRDQGFLPFFRREQASQVMDGIAAFLGNLGEDVVGTIALA